MINFKTRVGRHNLKVISKQRKEPPLTDEEILAIREKYNIVPKDPSDRHGHYK